MADTTILTNAGRNAEAAAIAGGTPLVIAELAWGDGDRYPAGGETALLSETGRKAVQAQGVPDGTLNQAFFRVFLDENEGPYVVREIGLFDDAGTLIALGRLDTPLNKPIGWTGTISMIVAFSNLENLVIEIDSVSAFVPAERRIDTGDGLQGGGDLSQDRTIEVAFASQAQANAGTSAVTVISPARLKGVLDARINASLVESGFEVMSSGRIEQWGVARLPASSANTSSVSIVLPMTWPNGLLSVSAIVTGPGNATRGGWPVISLSGYTRSTITFIADMLGFDVIDQAVWIRWRAVGH